MSTVHSPKNNLPPASLPSNRRKAVIMGLREQYFVMCNLKPENKIAALISECKKHRDTLGEVDLTRDDLLKVKRA